SVRSFSDDGGSLLVGTRDGLRRLDDGKTEPYPVPDTTPPFNVRALLRDRDGGLWIGVNDEGLVHVHQGRTDVFALRHGLSGDHITDLFEDREGSIWVATGNGLDRFRDVAVPAFGAGRGVSNTPGTSILAASDGSIWFGSDGVLRQRKDSRSTISPTDDGKPDGKAISLPNSLLEDRRGRIWVSAVDGIGYFENERYV